MNDQQLSDIFSSGNFGLWNQAAQAREQTQQKERADLQSVLGQEQRAKEMQPFDIAHKQATSSYQNALSKETEARLQDSIKTRMQKMTADQLANADREMEQMGRWAHAVENSGGLPPEMLGIPKEYASYFTPENIGKYKAAYKAYTDNHPKNLEHRAQEDARMKREQALAELRARTAAAGRAATKGKPQDSRTYNAEIIKQQNILTSPETTPEQKQSAAALVEFYREEMRQMEVLKSQSRLAGQIDLSGKGGLTTVAPPSTKPPANPLAAPAKPETTPKPSAYKTPDDVKTAFKAGKLTKQEAVEILKREHGME